MQHGVVAASRQGRLPDADGQTRVGEAQERALAWPSLGVGPVSLEHGSRESSLAGVRLPWPRSQEVLFPAMQGHGNVDRGVFLSEPQGLGCQLAGSGLNWWERAGPEGIPREVREGGTLGTSPSRQDSPLGHGVRLTQHPVYTWKLLSQPSVESNRQ